MEEGEKNTEVNMTPEIVTEKNSSTAVKRSPWRAYVVAAVAVVVILVGVVYLMEKQGRISTGFFTSPAEVAAKATVATVNGTEITGADLTMSVNQIIATAQQQGIDVNDANVQNDIQSQAVEMLVNTELLKQEATNRGLSIGDEQVDQRLELLVQEIGSEEALTERMAAIGIDQETLRVDIKSELLIQALLDQIFAEEKIEVTEDEVAEVYQSAGGAGTDLPALEEVRDQVEAQIRGSKEQEIIDSFIAELRAGAEVEVN